MVPIGNFQGKASSVFAATPEPWAAKPQMEGYVHLEGPTGELLQVCHGGTMVELVSMCVSRQTEKSFKRTLFRKNFRSGADKRNNHFRLTPYYDTKMGLLIDTRANLYRYQYRLVPLEDATVFKEESILYCHSDSDSSDSDSDSDYEPSTESEAEAEAKAPPKTPTRPTGPRPQQKPQQKPVPAAPQKPQQKVDLEGFTEEELEELERELDIHMAVQEVVDDWEFAREVERRANEEIQRRVAQKPVNRELLPALQEVAEAPVATAATETEEAEESTKLVEVEVSICVFMSAFLLAFVLYCAFLFWYLQGM